MKKKTKRNPIQVKKAINKAAARPSKQRDLKVLSESSLSQSIIGSMPGLFYLYDESGKFIHWNKNFETTSGYSASEVGKMHPLDFFHPDQKELLQNKIGEVFEKGEANIEADFYTKGKKRIPFYFNGYAISYKNKRCLMGVGIDISQRVLAEKKRAESEGQYRALFESNMDGILITDPGGQILHANVAARNMFRMTERELCVAGNAGVTDASDPRLQTLITQRRRDGKVQGELTLIRKGGEKFPAHITTSVFTDSVGQERMSIIIRDIVRLKDSETSLQKVNRELYLLNNANKLILKAFDEQTLMQQMCDLLVAEGNYKMCWIGLMPDRKSHFLVTPLTFAGSGENYIGEVKINLEDPKQMNGPTAKAMRSGQAVIVNHIAEDPDYIPWKKSAAKYGYASSASFPLILEKQVIASLNIYSSDVQSFDPEEVDILTAITDNLSYAIKGIRNTNNKKIAEKKLNDNEQNLQIIFSSTYDIIFMLSVEPFNRFKFMSINDAFLTTTGLKAEQVFDKYLDEVIPPDSLPMILEKYEAAVSSNKAMQWEETSQYPSGSKTGLVTITPVSDENGKPHRLVGFVHDITERKKAEEDMDRMNNQLRQLSNHIQTIGESERTAIAREIHDVLGQQMTALKYDIAWLKKKRNAAEADILQRIESMNKLVDETILSIRKVSSELRPKILDDLGLNAAIEWYVAAFEKNTGIRTEIDSDLEDISFEKLVSITIYRILQEALTNVARHAKAAKVHVSAKLKNNTIFLEVRDNGKGIAENEKQNTTSFGLLGISERAKMIGGDVIIQGIKGKGTSVLLKLPLHKNDTK